MRIRHASQIADKVFKLDPVTGRYIGFKEFTPDSVILAPDKFMEHLFYDVVPGNVALQMDRALFTARHHHTAVDFDCRVFGQWARCHAIVRDNAAHVNVIVRRRCG